YLACSSGGYIVRSMQVYNLPAGDVSIKWAHYSGPPGAAADLNTPWFSLAKDSYYDDYYVTARGWYDNVIGIGVSVNGGPWEVKFSQMYATSKLADGSEQAQLGFCFIDN
ncbi:MAG: hypothetical protein JWO02_2281, partial [Solirubrobacterales bacterium]|nr:hypothetical protein [Solirubrobacterales bacterium]